MKIAYIGRISFKGLEEKIRFDRPLPKALWGFGLGAAFVLGLLKRGHEVVVIDGCGGVEKMEKFRGRFNNPLSLFLVPERSFKWQMLTLYRKEVRAMRAVLDEVKPDVVFAQWTYQYAYAALTSGYPTLVVAHDSPWRILWTCRSLQSIAKAFYAQLFVLPRLKNVTTVSPYMIDELRRWNHYRGEITVVPNGIHLNGRLVRKVVREKARTVVCVGQWDRRKNPKCLLRAFAALHLEYPDWRLLYYGQGMNPEIAGAWMKKAGLSGDGIELRGQAERAVLDKVLTDEADVFCGPTLEESFGMVFVEAMLHGVPCVGGEKSGAVPWVMGDGGVVCDVTKPAKLAACLEKVMLDCELRKKLSENGVKRVVKNFDIEHVVDLYEKELIRVARLGTRG